MEHMRAAQRILAYVLATKGRMIELGGEEPLRFRLSVDASHGIHPNGRGQGSMIILLGRRIILVKTHRLPHVTLSSTESELSATCEASTYIDWLRLLGDEMCLEGATDALVLEQDNMASMFMNEMGKGTFKRSKHISIRSMFIKDLIDEGSVILTYTDTRSIVADLGTKVHNAERITELMQLMHVRDLVPVPVMKK
jgi:hypothetical protein